MHKAKRERFPARPLGARPAGGLRRAVPDDLRPAEPDYGPGQPAAGGRLRTGSGGLLRRRLSGPGRSGLGCGPVRESRICRRTLPSLYPPAKLPAAARPCTLTPSPFPTPRSCGWRSGWTGRTTMRSCAGRRRPPRCGRRTTVWSCGTAVCFRKNGQRADEACMGAYMAELLDYLKQAAADGASDLFIIAGGRVCEKNDKRMTPISAEKIFPQETERLILDMYHLAERDPAPYLRRGDDDFSFSVPGLARFRVNAYRQRGSLAAVVPGGGLPHPGLAGAGHPAGCHRPGGHVPRHGTGHRHRRQRQVHHPGVHHRPHQPDPGVSYHHAGGPHRISAPGPAQHRQPAGDRH